MQYDRYIGVDYRLYSQNIVIILLEFGVLIIGKTGIGTTFNTTKCIKINNNPRWFIQF